VFHTSIILELHPQRLNLVHLVIHLIVHLVIHLIVHLVILFDGVLFISK
jgi:hypothetical protein